MAVQHFASVTATDHEKLQKLVKHYPASSYADWCLKEDARKAEWRARRHTIQMVKVTPEEFAAFCERTGSPCDIITFKAFICR